MSDWDLLTPGIGLTSIGIVGVGISLSGIAKTFLDGMHAVSLLTMFIGMIFLASGLFKDGFPSSGRAKSATFITLGFLVTFGFAAAVTVGTNIPSIYAYIGVMAIIAIPGTVLAVAAHRRFPYLKALAVIFISASVVGATTFYAFGLVAPRPPEPEVEEEAPEPEAPAEVAPTNVINATILPGASAQGNKAYDPAEFTAVKGDAIQWTNKDNVLHTVTSFVDEGKTFDSPFIAKDNGTWTLNTANLAEGLYEYFCTLHPEMRGKFTVAAAGQPQAPAPEEPAANETAPEISSGNATSNETSGTPAAGQITTVSIVSGSSVATNDQFFVPETVQTKVGSMVRWVNDDFTFHTVTSGDAEANQPDGVFDSKMMKKEATFSFVFDTPGEYDYYCTLHPFMTGKVIVE